MAKILNGRLVRDSIAEQLKSQISKLRTPPKLVIIQVGDNPESNSYITQKVKFGERIGAIVEHKKFLADVSQQSLISELLTLNSSPSIHGIILQMPVPENLDKEKLINTIDPKKDVDGLTSTNQKLLEDYSPVTLSDSEESQKSDSSSPTQNDKPFIPATPKGVLSLLKFYKINPKGKKVTVLGRSKLVGAPLAILLRNLGAHVTVGHSQTEDLKAITKPADILVVAVGKQNLITKDHVSPGQVVVDIGINIYKIKKSQTLTQAKPESEPEPFVIASDSEAISNQITTSSTYSTRNDKKLTGDVDFDEVSKIVAAITPVPGGIGPMTVASLFENLFESYKRHNS